MARLFWRDFFISAQIAGQTSRKKCGQFIRQNIVSANARAITFLLEIRPSKKNSREIFNGSPSRILPKDIKPAAKKRAEPLSRRVSSKLTFNPQRAERIRVNVRRADVSRSNAGRANAQLYAQFRAHSPTRKFPHSYALSNTQLHTKLRAKLRAQLRAQKRACKQARALLGKRDVGVERYGDAILHARPHYHGALSGIDLQIMYFAPIGAVFGIVGDNFRI